MPLYRIIVKNAWLTTWRNKFLWPFGFLASFWGIGSTYEVVLRSLDLSTERELYWVRLWHDIISTGLNWESIKELFANGPLQVVLLLFFIILFGLVILFCFWLFTCSEIAVIKASSALLRKREIGNLFFESKEDFWPVFTVNLIGKVLIFLFLLLLSYPILQPLLGTEYSIPVLMVYILFYVVIVAVVLIISFVTIISDIHIVVNKDSVMSAIKKSWAMVVNNWLVCLETAILLFVISILVGFGLVLLTILLSIPYLMLFYLASVVIGSIVIYWLLLILALLTGLLVIFIVISLVTTFQLVLWVELFEKINNKSAVAKLERLGNVVLPTK
ncbi:MAG: hypothetical protein WC480_04960 [Patescibacteria group bacterium]